jgi:CRISPR-associated protein Cmr3
MSPRTWLIEPRDPLVFGEGRGPTEVGAQTTRLSPLPGTVAGMVRTAFYHAGTHDRLLDVRIERGPWIARRTGDRFEPWFPAPQDAAYGHFDVNGERGAAFARSRLLRLGDGEGVLWPHGPASPGALAMVAGVDRDDDGDKTRAAAERVPFWPLPLAVQWATSPEARVRAPADREIVSPIQNEARTHVKMDSASGTAEAGMLFSTPGLRFAEGFCLALEVQAHEGAHWPPGRDLVLLGGEGRPSLRSEEPRASFPAFQNVEKDYERGVHQGPSGLRIQLLTHAWMRPGARSGEPAWLPSWIDAATLVGSIEGVRLRVEAVCLAGIVPISGWDMVQGGPRRVRRLVPPGAVYYFRLLDEHEHDPLRAAAALWGRPFEPGGDARVLADEHLAPPAHDGYGLMLPGFWW